LEVIVARDEGKSGGSVCEEEGSRRGVEVFELSVEDGKTRFARKKLKNAVGKLKLAGGLVSALAQGAIQTRQHTRYT